MGAQRVHYDPATRQLRFDDPGVRIDLGGIAKGYAVDRVATALEEKGFRRYMVEVGGEVARPAPRPP